jgi:hypothetical protein
MHTFIYQKFIKFELNKPNESQQTWIQRHTCVSITKRIGFLLYMPSSSLFLVTSLLFGLTQVSCAHHLRIEYLISSIIPSIFFSLTISLQKATPLSHIRDHCINVIETLQWCTPRTLAMPLTKDALALIATI